MKAATLKVTTQVVLRIVAAVGGGYGVAAGLAALLAVALPPSTGLARSEAVVLASMLAFLLYLGLLIWGFAERRLMRLWLVYGAAGGASWAGAWALARNLA